MALWQTFNFAENGRHLANQNYRACIRQESDMCSIQYEPCFDRAFRIGPRRQIGGLGGGGPLGVSNLLDPLNPLSALSPLAGGGGGLIPGKRMFKDKESSGKWENQMNHKHIFI